MNTGGEAAEQIVRMSLEGFEVAAKITGAGAKNIAILLYSILKEEQKTKGKARLTNMLRSGKELKVFTVKSGDLKKFTQEAKKYGVLYCVLADRGNKDPNAEVDVIARAEDASKISRIVERFNLASVDAAYRDRSGEIERSKGQAERCQDRRRKGRRGKGRSARARHRRGGKSGERQAHGRFDGQASKERRKCPKPLIGKDRKIPSVRAYLKAAKEVRRGGYYGLRRKSRQSGKSCGR